MFVLYFIFLLPVLINAGPVKPWGELGFIVISSPGAAAIETGGVCETGTKQSPIDLNTCSSKKYSHLKLIGHGDVRPEGFIMKNTGHSAQIQFKGKTPTLIGGPLDGEYTFSQLHFHWGTADEGSEHSINGKFYALEGHFVHFKTSYGNIAEAASHSDGLAVVAIMFELSATRNAGLSDIIITSLNAIHPESSTTSLGASAMTWFDKLIHTFEYYTYPGSLTTTPCAESVTWLVIKQTSTITLQQIEEFRQLEGPDGLILENRREIQARNTRLILCETGCLKSS